MPYSIKSKYVENNKKRTWLKRISWLVLSVVILIVVFNAGMYAAERSEIVAELAKNEVVYLGELTGKYNLGNSGILTQDVNFSLFWDVWDTVKQDYVDKGEISEKEMFYGALEGMVSALGDPYTVFMNPKLAKDFEDDMSGTFEGIGAEIGIRNEVLTIIAPLEDTPAQKAGLKAGDKVYAVNGESTAGISIDEAVRKIRGQKGTEVVLTIYNPTLDETKDISIIRGVIVLKSIKTDTVSSGDGEAGNVSNNDDFFLVKITNFNGDTLKLFNETVRDILIKNPKGIILDLRNNPGGYLDTAIEIASEWVEEGVIVSEQYNEEQKDDYLARGRARLSNYPTVVLINEGSASASEIVAGALRDHNIATLIGKKTFGKGSVQAVREFDDGSSVKITVAKWLTPNGDSINEEGLSPDVEVELTIEEYKEDKDPQMDKAIEVLDELVD